MHLLNHVWPNIFETSPHVVNAVNGAIDGCRLALGPAVVLGYTLQASPLRARFEPCLLWPDGQQMCSRRIICKGRFIDAAPH